MSRALRLLQIIDLLKARPYTTDELSDITGMSKRTIQRDIAQLQSDPRWEPLLCRERTEYLHIKLAHETQKTCV